MFSIRPLSASPNRKGFSRTDMLTVGLMTMVLAGISLPLFHSATKSAPKQGIGPAMTAPNVTTQTTFAANFTPGVSPLSEGANAMKISPVR
jgi:hypothetical protein